MAYDTHCHLQDERLRPFLPQVMERAEQAGVARMLCCGSAESDWAGVAELAGRYPSVRPAFGLHPWYVAEATPDWVGSLRWRLQAWPTAVVGEIGLDHAVDPATYPAQEEAFLAQIRLAATLHRPVSVHCRRAYGRLINVTYAEAFASPRPPTLADPVRGVRMRAMQCTSCGAFFTLELSFEHGKKSFL